MAQPEYPTFQPIATARYVVQSREVRAIKPEAWADIDRHPFASFGDAVSEMMDCTREYDNAEFQVVMRTETVMARARSRNLG